MDNLRNIELSALPVYDNRHIRSKIRTYGDKVYTNFRSLDASEDRVECEFFKIISTCSWE